MSAYVNIVLQYKLIEIEIENLIIFTGQKGIIDIVK